MNLYVKKYDSGIGHVCRATNAEVVDAEGTVVGFVTPRVADWLVQQGAAMDLTIGHPFAALLAVIDGAPSRVCGVTTDGEICKRPRSEHSS